MFDVGRSVKDLMFKMLFLIDISCFSKAQDIFLLFQLLVDTLLSLTWYWQRVLYILLRMYVGHIMLSCLSFFCLLKLKICDFRQYIINWEYKFCVQVNTTLEVLDLSWNGFGLEGAIALQKALQVNTSLRVLDIS